MNVQDLGTYVENTWCPGCTNFGLLAAVKKAIVDLVNEGYDFSRFVISSGIGCHAKIYDYLGTNGFYSIHGRVPPTITGMKLANPELKVIGFAGDGDAYAEGLEHLIHAARFNADITMVIHNNQIFALTTGQPTPVTEQGTVTKATPFGNPYYPLNPLALMLEAGATFVAREYALDMVNLSNTLKEAVKHRGFSFVEVLQPCITFHDSREFLKERMYRVQPMSLEDALKVAREWNYDRREDARVPVGIFYRSEKPTLEEQLDVKVWHRVHPRREVGVEELWAPFI